VPPSTFKRTLNGTWNSKVTGGNPGTFNKPRLEGTKERLRNTPCQTHPQSDTSRVAAMVETGRKGGKELRMQDREKRRPLRRTHLSGVVVPEAGEREGGIFKKMQGQLGCLGEENRTWYRCASGFRKKKMFAVRRKKEGILKFIAATSKKNAMSCQEGRADREGDVG